jgi:hypothetical protein
MAEHIAVQRKKQMVSVALQNSHLTMGEKKAVQKKF